ncbi:hypothetical protein LCGC14_3101970, partial [marine sediment metagenome]
MPADPEASGNGLCQGFDSSMEFVFNAGGGGFGLNGFFDVAGGVGFDASDQGFGDLPFSSQPFCEKAAADRSESCEGGCDDVGCVGA